MLSDYRIWLRKNSAWLSAVEGVASSITWLLPDRFSDSEVKLEGVNSLLGLVSVLHSSLLVDPSTSQAGNSISWALVATQQVEALVELLAVHANRNNPDKDAKYNALIALEAAKAALRLMLLHVRGGRILLDWGTCLPGTSRGPGCTLDQQQRLQEVQDAFSRFRAKHNLPQLQPQTDGQTPAFAQPQGSLGSTVGINGKLGGALGRGPGALQCTVGGANVTEASKNRDGRTAMGTYCVVAGELLHVLRPLVYVTLLRRRGNRCWRPFLASLAMELASLQLTHMGGRWEALENSEESGNSGVGNGLGFVGKDAWTDAERQELMRRKMLLLYYLIRSPMYEMATRKGVLRVQGVLSYVPLLRTLTDKAVEILEGIQHYYTYTAAS